MDPSAFAFQTSTYIYGTIFSPNQSKPNHTQENPYQSEKMLSPFSCGFFHPETSDEYDEPIITNSPCSTPRRSSSRRSGGLIHRIHHSNKDSNKNPYSTRGLDKFSALVADLEEKRKQIYAQTGSEDDTFVRFVYKDSNDNVPVPIVLKLKDKKLEEQQQKKKHHRHNNHEEKLAEGLDKMTVTPSVAPAKEEAVVEQQQPNKKSNMFDFLTEINFKRPSFYLPVVVVLILVLLAVFGRSVAILCTSIGWYAIPTLKEHSSNRRRRSSKPKVHNVKRASENKVASSSTSESSSPKSDSISTPLSRKHDHRKSW